MFLTQVHINIKEIRIGYAYEQVLVEKYLSNLKKNIVIQRKYIITLVHILYRTWLNKRKDNNVIMYFLYKLET